MNIINIDDNISISSNISINTCSICLTSINNNIKTLECTHTFHINCIDMWIDNKNSCPLCRAIINKQPNIIPEQSIHHQITIPMVNQQQNIISIKKCKLKFLFLITFIFFIISIIYLTYYINKTNNYINKIIIYKNETELNNKQNHTYSSFLLIFIEIMFFIVYYILNLNIFKNKIHNLCYCVFFLIFVIYVFFWLIIVTFYNNTISYLKNEKLELNQNNLKYLIYGYISFSVCIAFNMLSSFISYMTVCI